MNSPMLVTAPRKSRHPNTKPREVFGDFTAIFVLFPPRKRHMTEWGHFSLEVNLNISFLGVVGRWFLALQRKCCRLGCESVLNSKGWCFHVTNNNVLSILLDRVFWGLSFLQSFTAENQYMSIKVLCICPIYFPLVIQPVAFIVYIWA